MLRPVRNSLWSFLGWGVCLIRLSDRSSDGECLLNVPCLYVLLSVGVFLLHTASCSLSVRSAVEGSVFNALFKNLSRRSVRGEFLLQVPCWKLFGRSSGQEGGESLLHALCSSLSGVSSGGETLFQALHWNLSHRWVGG